jgi:hypothetical protein
MEPIKHWQNKVNQEKLYRMLGTIEKLDLIHISLPQVLKARDWFSFMESI